MKPVVALRRFRRPVPVRVQTEDGRPVRVGGGHVAVAAGPWRTSGAWWENGPVSPKLRSSEGGWDCDEWDVALADGVTYRLFHERLPTDLSAEAPRAKAEARSAKAGVSADSRRAKWFVEGVVD